MKKFIFILLTLLITVQILFGQQTAPKREFRGAWLSTVVNIDWPSAPGNSVDKMKSDLIEIFDYLKDANLNAVVFQIRPACDAMYYSEMEPWSYWLTGQQGKAPVQFFDPLEFAIEESHKRGMELHAWFNPYRVKLASWSFLNLDENNVARKNPDWVLNVNGDQILDPGLPQVREHVFNVVMDVVRRYEVDGIHFDDYFYLQGITNQDDETYAQYDRGISNRGDWRRDNVNELLRMIYAGIQNEKPYVKFGQSPRGIWKSGTPAGISGGSAYSDIYCDAVAWLDEQIIDYLTPQLYWPFGGGQDYGKLMPWWITQRNGRQIIPGLPFYRVGASNGIDGTQLGKMITLNRETEGNYGEIFFTAGDFRDNNLNNTDTLKNNYYKYKALIPSMEWKDQTAPGNPSNLRFDRVAGLGTTALTWDKPADEDVAWYAIYSFNNSNITIDDLQDPQNIFDVTSKNYYMINENFSDQPKYYLVTALDHNQNESEMSNEFQFQPNISLPDVPLPLLPLAGSDDISNEVVLTWGYADNAASYSLEVSEQSDFSSLFFSIDELIDTSFNLTGIYGETTYYWRIKAVNIAGQSDYSQVFDFTTAFPAAPQLIAPLDLMVDAELQLQLEWSSRSDAINYRVQLFEGSTTAAEAIVIDSTTTETSISTPELKPFTIYSWRVSVENQIGISQWASIFKFRTILILPGTPVINLPTTNANDIPSEVLITWNEAQYADHYKVQVATDENFQNIFSQNSSLFDTEYFVAGLSGETKYFVRVQSINNGGVSEYSSIVNFSTGFPALPQLFYPPDLTLGVEQDPIYLWSSSTVNVSYQLQIAVGNTVTQSNLIVDTIISDTSFVSMMLELNTIYSWRVNAFNDIGESGWTNAFKFRTSPDSLTSVEDSSIPTEFALYQNYPNPFNPSTTITIDIPKTSFTNLSIFNILGQRVFELINRELTPGTYNFLFDASAIPSGVYFYVLTSNEKKFSKKMILLK